MTSGFLYPFARNRGFSLTELIVVIVIVGALAAVGIPRFVDTQTFQERGFYDEALSAARYAQKFAVATGCPVQLTINSGVYTLNQGTTCTSGIYTANVVNPATRATTFTATAPSGVTFTMGPTTVVFDALGQASGDRTVTVGSRSFQIIGATGFVKAGS
jgi:MSHA pilin protein MshC